MESSRIALLVVVFGVIFVGVEVIFMKYLTDEKGNITDVVLNIDIFNSLPDEIKDFLLI